MNLRAVMTFREISRGHEALNTFTSIMNKPPPPPQSSNNYNSINDKLNPLNINCANENFLSAGEEVRKLIKRASNIFRQICYSTSEWRGF